MSTWRSGAGGTFSAPAVHLPKQGCVQWSYRVNLSVSSMCHGGAEKRVHCDRDNLLKVGLKWEIHVDLAISRAVCQPLTLTTSSSLTRHTAHNNNGFVEYNERIFSWDQVRLAAAARSWERTNVLVTNAHHDRVIQLYRGFDTIVLERASTLAASKESGRTSGTSSREAELVESNASVRVASPNEIRPNPENPRLVFKGTS